MAWKKKLVNHTNILDYKIEAITRCILPDILADYESEEGQRAFVQWQKSINITKRKMIPRRKKMAVSTWILPLTAFTFSSGFLWTLHGGEPFKTIAKMSIFKRRKEKQQPKLFSNRK